MRSPDVIQFLENNLIPVDDSLGAMIMYAVAHNLYKEPSMVTNRPKRVNQIWNKRVRFAFRHFFRGHSYEKIAASQGVFKTHIHKDIQKLLHTIAYRYIAQTGEVPNFMELSNPYVQFLKLKHAEHSDEEIKEIMSLSDKSLAMMVKRIRDYGVE